MCGKLTVPGKRYVILTLLQHGLAPAKRYNFVGQYAKHTNHTLHGNVDAQLNLRSVKIAGRFINQESLI